tara:strand:+ start:4951 stop:5949 length:999 start_codon:yes stop_codon:yes gene_type:complete
MKNKKVIAEIKRAREMMGLELLNEQSISPCMEISTTVCYEGNIGQPTGTPVQFPCSLVDTQYPTQSLVGEKVQDMGAGYGQGTYEITSVSANPNYTGPTPSNPHLTVHAAWKYPCGGSSCTPGVDCWECTTPGAACQQTTNGTHQSAAACQTACQPQMNDYECVNGTCVVQSGGQYTGPTALADCQSNCSVDCTQYGVDYDPVTLDNSAGGWFLQGINLATNGNCNGIQNKIQQVNNIPNQDKKDCRLDYLNLLLALCQGNSGAPTLNPAWITLMTNRYNGTGALSGCWGLTGTNTNSVCGRKAHFCPGSTPMKQAKCQWLTNFTSTNNCNC